MTAIGCRVASCAFSAGIQTPLLTAATGVGVGTGVGSGLGLGVGTGVGDGVAVAVGLGVAALTAGVVEGTSGEAVQAAATISSATAASRPATAGMGGACGTVVGRHGARDGSSRWSKGSRTARRRLHDDRASHRQAERGRTSAASGTGWPRYPYRRRA